MRRVVDRVKVLLTLTLPCQETNPDGVIWVGLLCAGLKYCGVTCEREFVEMGWLGISIDGIGSSIRFRWGYAWRETLRNCPWQIQGGAQKGRSWRWLVLRRRE